MEPAGDEVPRCRRAHPGSFTATPSFSSTSATTFTSSSTLSSASTSATMTAASRSSSSSISPSTPPSSITSSVVSKLERMVADEVDSDNSCSTDFSDTAKELPLLWSAVEETARAQMTQRDIEQDLPAYKNGYSSLDRGGSPTTNNLPNSSSTANCVGNSSNRDNNASTHARFVREVTGLLWGEDYPSWMEEQWLQQGDVEEGEEEEEEENGNEITNDQRAPQPSFSLGGVNKDSDEMVAGAGAEGLPGTLTVETAYRKEEPYGKISSPNNAADRADGEKADDDATMTVAVVAAAQGGENQHRQQGQQMSLAGLSIMMQRALEALQLSLPLQEQLSTHTEDYGAASAASPSPAATSNDRNRNKKRERHAGDNGKATQSAVDLLARHVIQDAPLLWLHYLLVPMYTQWIRLRESTFSEDKSTNSNNTLHKGGGAAPQPPVTAASSVVNPACSAPPSCTYSSEAFVAATPWNGAVTMHRLLHALSTSNLHEALLKEKTIADDLLNLIRCPPTVVNESGVQNNSRTRSKSAEKDERGSTSSSPGTGAAAAHDDNSRPTPAEQKQHAARDALKTIQRRQRQHVSELLCFAGTLARAAQSFTVLGSGGFTLLCVFVARFIGYTRAAWGEWARARSTADLSRDGPLRTMLRASNTHHGTHGLSNMYTFSNGGSDDERDECGEQHRKKRHRAEVPSRTETTKATTHNTNVHDTPSSASSSAAAPTVVDALAALRVSLNSAARQHALHLWRCWLILFGFYGTDIYTNEAVARVLSEEEMEKAGVTHMSPAQKAQWHKLRLKTKLKQHTLSETHWLWCLTVLSYMEDTLREFVASEPRKSGPMTILYRFVVADALRVFCQEVRDVLKLHGQAMLALRSGALQSATSVVPSTLQSATDNVLGLQTTFQRFLLDAFNWTAILTTSIDEKDGEMLEDVNGAEDPKEQQRKRVDAGGNSEGGSQNSLWTQAGTFIWQIYPTLLRTQSPEEVSWMGNSSNSTAYAAVDALGGAGEDGDVAVAEFEEQQNFYLRRRGVQLSALLADTNARMEAVLIHTDALNSSSDLNSYHGEPNPHFLPSLATTAAVGVELHDEHDNAQDRSGDDIAGGYASVVQLFERVIFANDLSRPTAPSSADIVIDTSASAHPLDSIAEIFPSIYDPSCFFVLQPERQRLFTRSIQKMCDVLTGTTTSNNKRDENTVEAVSSLLNQGREAQRALLLSSLRYDTRLWMLLLHGVLLQLERRGRLACEDEALLIKGLLPLLSALSSSRGVVRGRMGDISSATLSGLSHTSNTPAPLQTAASPATTTVTTNRESQQLKSRENDAEGVSAWPSWADLSTAQDLLLLLASGLLTLPWNVEGIYIAVRRHTILCARYGQQREQATQHRNNLSVTDADKRLSNAVMYMSQWFTGVSSATAGASSTTARTSAATQDVWSFSESRARPSSPSSPVISHTHRFGGCHTNGGDGTALLSDICAQIDLDIEQEDNFLRQLHAMEETGHEEKHHEHPHDHPRSYLSSELTVGMDVTAGITDEEVERYIYTALEQHARVTAAFTSSGACGALIIIGAYRTLSRGLYRLRVALEEQLRMAREDDVGEFVGRSVTFCASEDINICRTLLTVVHRCVFVSHCQPVGLLRLWCGYLQQLFVCLVPSSSLSTSAQNERSATGGNETLVLMPNSWQLRHHVVSIFNERVYRTGWRALQHDGEPAPHTRLREVLGESLADLFITPFYSSESDATKPTSASDSDEDEDTEDYSLATEHQPKTSATSAAVQPLFKQTKAVLPHTLPHAVMEVLCELLSVPVDGTVRNYSLGGSDLKASTAATAAVDAMEACRKAIGKSFLGVAGLIAFLRRLEMIIVPGSLRDPRLTHMLRCVYAAADAAAVGV